jgi:valyl-tRNA synthetase
MLCKIIVNKISKPNLCKSAILTSMRLPKVYEPAQYEADIYALWEKKDVFKPQNRGGEGYFSMVLPPPNANANLHIGYGLTVAIHDILARYHRMQGRAVLIVPGADHAGFETWAVYEKKLNKEGKSRFDFSRDDLYKQVWDFVQSNKHGFESQLRALGTSCDWSRYTFTLDNKVVAQAYKTFKQMWDDKLIYRGERLVNYCTFHQTSFADIEVVYEEAKTPLYYIKYGPFTLATTRPETKFGDTAVAVHPNDPRYKEYVGQTITVEGVNGPFEVRVVEDEMVDPKFGTGAVKITPAHSFDDWEVAQRHNLPIKQVINHDGTLNEHAGRFSGMSVEQARKAVVKAMEEKGLLVKVDNNYKNRIGKCYKCGTVIEPMLMKQWFVHMEPLAKKAIATLNDKKIVFHPDGKRQQLIRYLEGLKDWNISRQIVWGIPIPAFQNVDDPNDWIFDPRVHEETIEAGGKKYKRDPDTLDTWFSSSSWPYVTLDFPDGEDYKHFYPLSLMDTGGEILYPWVSRMIMLGDYVTKNIPFKEVYIHGYVMAQDGAKMSKSLGNTVDLSETVAKYGSDALRMGIIAGRVPGVNRPYDSRRLEEARNFSNKIWNIARYIEDRVGDNHYLRAGANALRQTAADHWIMHRLKLSADEISRALENYRLSEAYEILYHFIWHDLADWYIEASKLQDNPGFLAYILEAALKLAHPFAPFVTETIWQTLAWEQGSFLAVQPYAELGTSNTLEAQKFEDIIGIISEARHISSVLNLKKPKLYYQYSDAIVDQVGLIIKLANLGGVEETKSEKHQGLRLTSTKHAVWLEVNRKTAAAYMNKLEEERRQRQQSLKNLEGRLSNKSYTEKAPTAVVEQTRKQLAQEQELLKTLDQELENFKNATKHI